MAYMGHSEETGTQVWGKDGGAPNEKEGDDFLDTNFCQVFAYLESGSLRKHSFLEVILDLICTLFGDITG